MAGAAWRGAACTAQHAARAAKVCDAPSLPSPLPPRQVCSTACDPSSPTCQPLKAFRLRLANAVLAKPSDFIEGPTEGSIAATCADGGAGWWLRGAELGYLAETPVVSELLVGRSGHVAARGALCWPVLQHTPPTISVHPPLEAARMPACLHPVRRSQSTQQPLNASPAAHPPPPTHPLLQSAECEKFEVTVFNQPGGEVPMLLSELCQQGVQIVRPDGTVAFDQAAEGASCLYTLELADGTAGVAALAKAGAVKPPPTPSPSPRLPPPSLRPTPYYYGSSARRLQQVGTLKGAGGLLRAEGGSGGWGAFGRRRALLRLSLAASCTHPLTPPASSPPLPPSPPLPCRRPSCVPCWPPPTTTAAAT